MHAQFGASIQPGIALTPDGVWIECWIVTTWPDKTQLVYDTDGTLIPEWEIAYATGPPE